jgi:hypothetical protein
VIDLTAPRGDGSRFALSLIWDSLKANAYKDRTFLLSRADFDDLPLLLNGWTDWTYHDGVVRGSYVGPAISFHGIKAVLDGGS